MDRCGRVRKAPLATFVWPAPQPREAAPEVQTPSRAPLRCVSIRTPVRARGWRDRTGAPPVPLPTLKAQPHDGTAPVGTSSHSKALRTHQLIGQPSKSGQIWSPPSQTSSFSAARTPVTSGTHTPTRRAPPPLLPLQTQTPALGEAPTRSGRAHTAGTRTLEEHCEESSGSVVFFFARQNTIPGFNIFVFPSSRQEREGQKEERTPLRPPCRASSRRGSARRPSRKSATSQLSSRLRPSGWLCACMLAPACCRFCRFCPTPRAARLFLACRHTPPRDRRYSADPTRSMARSQLCRRAKARRVM